MYIVGNPRTPPTEPVLALELGGRGEGSPRQSTLVNVQCAKWEQILLHELAVQY